MSQRDQLVENIEDAFMSLFMIDVAEYEGQKFIEENERLKSDANFKVSPELDRRCLRAIKKTERKSRVRSTGKRIYRVFSKLSVAAVIALALFTSAYAAFPSVRATTLNLLIQVSDIATEFTFGDTGDYNGEFDIVDTPSGSISEGSITMGGYVIPESIASSYRLIDKGNDWLASWGIFRNEYGSIIYLDIQFGQDSTVNVNTEDATSIQEIDVGRFEGIIVQKDKVIIAGIADKDKSNFILITFEETSFESCIRITNEFLNAN